MSGREGEVVAFIALVLVLSIAPIIVAARLAERRGRSVWFGIVLAVLLGWIGVLVVLISGRRNEVPVKVASTRRRPCPSCGAAMPATAATCAGCGTASTPWTSHSGHWWARDDDGEWRYLDDARGVWVSPTDGSTTTADTVAPAPAGIPPRTSSRPVAASAFAGIDHVQVAAPPDREFDARRFYGGLLGLPEVDRPFAPGSRGGCWFQVGGQMLHVVATDDLVPAATAHPALRLRGTAELEELGERLEAAGYDVVWADEAEARGMRRFHVRDPFGNRIELLA